MLQKIINGFALLFWNPLLDKIYAYVSWYTLWNHAWKKVKQGIKSNNGVGVPIMITSLSWELVTAFETYHRMYHLYLNRFKSKYCIIQSDGIIIQFGEIYNVHNPEYKIQSFCNQFRYNYMIELAATGKVHELDQYIRDYWKEIMQSMNNQIDTGEIKPEEL